MNKIKYVMFQYKDGSKPDFVIFNRRYIHKNVFDEFLMQTFTTKDFPDTITAGFISVNSDSIKAHGNSESLDKESAPGDTAIINDILNDNKIMFSDINNLDADLLSFVDGEQKQLQWRQWYLEKY